MNILALRTQVLIREVLLYTITRKAGFHMIATITMFSQLQ